MASFSRLGGTSLCNAVARRLCVTTLLLCLACDSSSRLDDTLGVQSSARWEWHGRITVTQDPRLTLTRLAIDTGHGGGDLGPGPLHFHPPQGGGDGDSLTLAPDPGPAREPRQNG